MFETLVLYFENVSEEPVILFQSLNGESGYGS